MFNHISKHLEVPQKYSAACRIQTLLSVFGNVKQHGLSCLIPLKATLKGIFTKMVFTRWKKVSTLISLVRFGTTVHSELSVGRFFASLQKELNERGKCGSMLPSLVQAFRS